MAFIRFMIHDSLFCVCDRERIEGRENGETKTDWREREAERGLLVDDRVE